MHKICKLSLFNAWKRLCQLFRFWSTIEPPKKMLGEKHLYKTKKVLLYCYDEHGQKVLHKITFYKETEERMDQIIG